MAPTPLHGPPAPPLTVSVRGQPTEKKKKIKRNSNSNTEKQKAAAGPLFAFALLFSFPWVDAAGICQGPEGWDAQGRKRHGWRARAYRDVFTASPGHPTPPAQPMTRSTRPTHEGLRRSREHHFAGDTHMSITALNTSVPARSRTVTVTGNA